MAMLALCPPYGRAQPAPRRGGPSQARWRGGERFGDRRFSRRDALCASAWYGLPDARAFHPHPMRRGTARWPTGRMPRSSRCLPIRACGARPSAARPSRWDTGLGSRPQDFAKGPFLGGTHSVRPRGTAFRMPGHFIPTRCAGEPPVGLPGTCLGQAGAFLSGRAEPAPPRGASLAKRPWGANPGITRRVFFLGGTHSVRPHGKAPRMPRHCIFTRR